MKKELRILYGVIAVMVLSITTIGATYAYWTASTSSVNSTIKTASTIYSISMDITPLYNDFSFIPMNDEDALKGIGNKCVDKYERGACSAYKIHVYGYNEKLDFISGFMDIETNNMINLSYMMLRTSDNFNEETCVKIEDENYCIVQEATPMGIGENLSLGKAHDVTGQESADFILIFWLTNLQESQNAFDIGSFTASITMQAGNGGEIKGTIASAVKVNPTPDAGTVPDSGTTEPENGTETDTENEGGTA